MTTWIDAGLGATGPLGELDDVSGSNDGIRQIDVQGIAKGLRKFTTSGLPATVESAGDLLDLRSVVARSVHPTDPQSRLSALNTLLVRLIVESANDDPDSSMAIAARIVFGIAKGTRGTTHTRRRELASGLLAFDVDHFRKRIEPKLVETVASAMYADLLRYKRRIKRSPESEEPTGDTPSITADDFTHEEELISRIWSEVYALRAELIAVGRLKAQPGGEYASQAQDHRREASLRQAKLDALLVEWKAIYGDRFIRHGGAEFVAEGVRRISISPT